MSDRLDDFVQELQEKIFQEARETYGDTVYERWLNPLYMGELKNYNGYSRLRGQCGDTIEIFLKFEKGRVIEASFKTDGCGASTACGSFATEMAIGKTPDELLEITGEAVLNRAGGLPQEDKHCAVLAAGSLQDALEDYMRKKESCHHADAFD